MAQSLTKRLALCLQLLAGTDVLFPGSGEILGVEADFRPPGFAVGEQHTENCERHRDPSSAVIGDGYWVSARLCCPGHATQHLVRMSGDAWKQYHRGLRFGQSDNCVWSGLLFRVV